ncbi:hypothetical protein B0H67DRAFT_644527 [Lasiosphaeris hirsuta]|uniref:C2H2-type domain-containing protein n=1 Tax=Lasiosphaeris hirsuta TaxID=260670 RepID=A0AA40AF31_9PEZI|nr:hypothetical protein B0H67DRAFT_644527 [Lasiosphaeris hirsuta]
MEAASRGSRYPAVPSRVAHKLGSDIAISIPLRPRRSNIALTARGRERERERERDDAATKQQHRDTGATTPVDASSLAGTTAPNSPILDDLPDTPAAPMATHHLLRDPFDLTAKAVTPQTMTIKAPDSGDESFRKGHRALDSIDSLLSSTTCVNTQSECSRPASRVSRAGTRYDIDGTLSLDRPTPGDAAKYVQGHGHGSDAWLTPGRSLVSRHRSHSLSAAGPTSCPTFNITSHGHCEGELEAGGVEEERVVNEISSWVLRNVWGKEVDECAAPLLVSDCTSRYIQELWTAADEGKLRQAGVGSSQASPSYGGVVQGSGNNTPTNNQSSNGKRKADGGNEGGDDGYGDQDERDDDQGNSALGVQRYTGKASNSSNFSCPYRKRNPLRFNVRSYHVCATHSFADMSQLKKHIRAHHPPLQRNSGPFQCPRCFNGFQSKNDVDDHLRQPQLCHVTVDQGGANPEDGITQKIIKSLEARAQNLKIDNWVSLWRLLFPNDKKVPDPAFVPVMEVFDFIAESKKVMSKLRDLLDLQYHYILEGTGQSADMELKIHQGLDRSTRSISTWIETIVQDWELRLTGTSSFSSQSDLPGNTLVADDSWAGLPPSPALTPTVIPGSEVGAVVGISREGSPGSSNQGPTGSAPVGRRNNPPLKKARRSEGLTSQLPVPSQKSKTPQPQGRTLPARRNITVLPSQSMLPTTLPSNTPVHNPTPTYAAQPQAWEYSQAPSYGPQYTMISPGLPPQHPPTPQYPPISQPQSGGPMPSPYLGPEPTPADHQQQPYGLEAIQQQHQQHENTSSPRHSSSTTANTAPYRGSGASSLNRLTYLSGSTSTPRSSVTSVWRRDSMAANRDSSQTLVDPHADPDMAVSCQPHSPCQSYSCPSCSGVSKMGGGVGGGMLLASKDIHAGLGDMRGTPAMGVQMVGPDGLVHHGAGQGMQTVDGHQHGHGHMVFMPGFEGAMPVHHIGEEHHGGFGGSGEWVHHHPFDGGAGGAPTHHGGMFGHGLQEGF